MNVQWEHEYNTGLARARESGKPVFLDFFNPG